MQRVEGVQPRIVILDLNRFELATISDSMRLQGIDVLGQATDAQTCEHLVRALSPDAILIDYQGCDEPILKTTHHLRTINPALGIVLLTNSPDVRLYGISEDELPVGTQLCEKSALSELRQLRTAIECSIEAGAKTAWVVSDSNSTLNSLTNVQVETLRLLALGLSNSDIGRARFVSEKSVEQTIARVAHHLHVSHEHGRNLRVILAAEYFGWLGAPRRQVFATRS